jgi:hypothetical protein
MLLHEPSGIQYFDDNIIVYLQGALQKFLLSPYIRTLLSENGQSSLSSLSKRNYISVENYVGNCVLTHMALVYVYVDMKWHINFSMKH